MAKTDGVQTLEDLKAENAAADLEETSPPQADDFEEEAKAVDDETEETGEDAETEPEETETSKTEDWMEADGHTSESAEKKYSGSDIGAAKAKVRAKLEKKYNSEIEALKAENAQLKSQKPMVQPVKGEPKYEDFIDEDNPDAAYNAALVDYKLEVALAARDAKQANQTLENEQRQTVERIDKAVDQHTERAVKLIEGSNISPDAYREAEYRVREVVDTIFPGLGDTVTDGLIANLGKGSEKVMYSLGVNQQRRDELKTRLMNDKTGLQAAMYLGSLKEKFNAPLSRKSRAPAPASEVTGDNAAPVEARRAKKAFDKAAKNSDTQAMFNAKQAAKKAGVDTSLW